MLLGNKAAGRTDLSNLSLRHRQMVTEALHHPGESTG